MDGADRVCPGIVVFAHPGQCAGWLACRECRTLTLLGADMGSTTAPVCGAAGPRRADPCRA
jgi:hypothetical protein